MASKKMSNEEIDKQIEQLKNLKKQNAEREKAQERKDRTHRLIQIGAEFEKYFKTSTIEQAEELIKKLAEKYAQENSPT